MDRKKMKPHCQKAFLSTRVEHISDATCSVAVDPIYEMCQVARDGPIGERLTAIGVGLSITDDTGAHVILGARLTPGSEEVSTFIEKIMTIRSMLESAVTLARRAQDALNKEHEEAKREYEAHAIANVSREYFGREDLQRAYEDRCQAITEEDAKPDPESGSSPSDC